MVWCNGRNPAEILATLETTFPTYFATISDQPAGPVDDDDSGADDTPESAGFRFSYSREEGVLRWKNPPKHARGIAGDPAGSLHPSGYIIVGIGGGKYPAHRVIWLMETGAWPEGEIDHINGIRHDNRWENLRDVSTAVNQQNQREGQAGSRSGLLGVYPNPGSQRNPWKALIKPDGGKLMHLGSFPTPEAAHDAYLAAKRSMHEGCTI